MTGFLGALVGLTSTVVARVLVALGLAVVTVTGVAVVVSTLKTQVLAMLGAAPLAALQLAGLAGTWQALGILFGAMTACVSYWTLTKATQVLASA